MERSIAVKHEVVVFYNVGYERCTDVAVVLKDKVDFFIVLQDILTGYDENIGEGLALN